MNCFECDSGVMLEERLRFEEEFRGSVVDFVAPAMKCQTCGAVMSTLDQTRLGRVALADAYRKKKGLLTSEQIKDYRCKFEMSQDQFSDFLGVGIASLKRWESTTVQDPSNDELIRLKCDPTYADANLIVNLMTMERSELNGGRKFSPETFAQVLLRILPYAQSPLFFFKAMFYVDFYHWKRHGVGVTGCTYCALQYGPVPKYYDAILDYIKTKGWVSSSGSYNLKAGDLEIDDSDFSQAELDSIDKVVQLLKVEGPQYVFNLSHKEKAYKQTDPYDVISYSFASDLSL